MLTLDRIKEVVYEIAPKYEIEKVYLFGSYARGDMIEESDVDLRIIGGNIRTLVDHANLIIEMEKIFKKSVDILTPGAITERFHNLIKDTEVLIYENK